MHLFLFVCECKFNMLISVIHKDNGTFGSSVRVWRPLWVCRFGGLDSTYTHIHLPSAYAPTTHCNVYTTYPKINNSIFIGNKNYINIEVSCKTTHSILGTTYVHRGEKRLEDRGGGEGEEEQQSEARKADRFSSTDLNNTQHRERDWGACKKSKLEQTTDEQATPGKVTKRLISPLIV